MADQVLLTAEREHEISCGHRVVGHEGKCQHLHGHNYLFRFTCTAPALDVVGRVIDFSVIKSRLCAWLEENWDHRFLAFSEDPMLSFIEEASGYAVANPTEFGYYKKLYESLVLVPFNPTAENIALHMLKVVGPKQLEGTGVTLIQCFVGETRRCGATARL